ncbi:MAG TPA: SLC13 family permease [Xanthomonadales bacterium]|nr:SLC13 family permease [Xanthomonadales bacterium]
MTIQIAFVYLVLLASLVFFITEWLRVDLVALLVLGSLAITGLVTADEAFSGFSNPAVITVWAMFIISEGLSKTGIASHLGRQVMQVAGSGESRLVGFITVLAAVMSAFMNNIGVAALLLPVAMDICRTTGISPSRVLMPMAFGTLLGGLTTQIGTPPNLLISAMMVQNGYESFGLLDFSLVGVPILIAGTVFFQLAGRHLLPAKAPNIDTERPRGDDLQWRYGLGERTYLLGIPEESLLIGRTISQSKLAASAGLKVIAMLENDQASLLPPADTRLEAGRQLMVQGKLDNLERLREWGELEVSSESSMTDRLASSEIYLIQGQVSEGSGIIGKVPDKVAIRDYYFCELLAVRRGDSVRSNELSGIRLEEGDVLLFEGGNPALEALEKSSNFENSRTLDDNEVNLFQPPDRQDFVINVPADSSIIGQSLRESGISQNFDFSVLGLVRDGKLEIVPSLDNPVSAEDKLLIRGTPEQVEVFRGLQEFMVISTKPADLDVLESEKMALIEVTLQPRSKFSGQTVNEVQFESRYGLELLAIWRTGRAHRADLGSMELKVGDAFLLLGPRDKLRQFEDESDFLVLTPMRHRNEQTDKAAAAGFILVGVVGSVLLGWLPISVAAVVGGALMVTLKCITMEEAYQAIEWRSIFLIAGMLPLGIALESTGGAAYMANSVMNLMSGSGPFAIIFAFYAMTALATLFVPTAALVVLMGPIVMTASADLGIHPQTAMMAVAIAASASFASPVSHPANLLIMGPGGYRFSDYLKLGLPLTILVGLITAALLPIAWPLQPAVAP